MISNLAKNTVLALLAAAIATACGATQPPTDPSAPGTTVADVPSKAPAPAAATTPSAIGSQPASAPSAAPANGACASAGGHCVNITAMVACKGKPPAACATDEYCCVM